MAAEHMRASDTAIRELPITERPAPSSGQVGGKVVATNGNHVAFATAPNSFVVVRAELLGRNVQVGERLSLRFSQGRVCVEADRNRGR
jgi:hypothetical protein